MESWITLIIAAARHSPEALAFVKEQLDPTNCSSPMVSIVAKDMHSAKLIIDLIIEEKLPYEIIFQCTPDTIAFKTVLETLSSLCPNWQLSPRCDYYIENKAAEYVDYTGHAGLIERTSYRKTQGGFPYERLIVCVNQNAAAMLKMYDIITSINDYSDIMEKYM